MVLPTTCGSSQAHPTTQYSGERFTPHSMFQSQPLSLLWTVSKGLMGATEGVSWGRWNTLLIHCIMMIRINTPNPSRRVRTVERNTHPYQTFIGNKDHFVIDIHVYLRIGPHSTSTSQHWLPRKWN